MCGRIHRDPLHAGHVGSPVGLARADRLPVAHHASAPVGRMGAHEEVASEQVTSLRPWMFLVVNIHGGVVVAECKGGILTHAGVHDGEVANVCAGAVRDLAVRCPPLPHEEHVLLEYPHVAGLVDESDPVALPPAYDKLALLLLAKNIRAHVHRAPDIHEAIEDDLPLWYAAQHAGFILQDQARKSSERQFAASAGAAEQRRVRGRGVVAQLPGQVRLPAARAEAHVADGPFNKTVSHGAWRWSWSCSIAGRRGVQVLD
mmetsp:Transcript_85552/g.237089  ORF Transcript_85552/g.237089 Transcript_85552/m.237089 type:complete len:259 (-) Transcript_85552:875-1651(-)